MRPRRLVHRGVVQASGFHFSPGWTGLRRARARILARWTPGAHVFEHDGELVLLLPAPVEVRVAGAPGAPLVQDHGRLTAVPLEEDESKRLPASRDDVVIALGGRALILELDRKDELDPARWLDTEPYAARQATPVGALPLPPPPAAEPTPRSVQAVLGVSLPPPSPERVQVALALARGATPALATAGAGAQHAGAAPTGEPLGERISRWLRHAVGWVLARTWPQGPSAQGPALPAVRGERGLRAAAGPSLAGASEDPPRPGLWSRARGRLQALVTRFLRATHLQRLVGQRQAEYLARVMEMFDEGDLDAALHHAIPLSEVPSAARAPAPALGVPSPRKTLAISARGPTSSGGGIAVGSDLFESLRTLYRRAFERLKREGRLEEAAFVLAELLGSSAEAVMFLEVHGRLRLAAELAEARKLEPGLVVRQWFLAGEVDRAVELARRTGAFADAVLRLERSDPEKAHALRVLWADTLAEVGDFAAAVEVIWPVERARALARTWLANAVSGGGPAGARALVRSVVMLPEDFASLLDRALSLLDDESFDGLSARAALAAELCATTPTPQTRVLARPALRAMLRDAGRWGSPGPREHYDRLARISEEQSLRADLPPLPVRGQQLDLRHREHPRTYTFTRHDTGTLVIHDVALLPSGRILVALGEAGVRLLTRDGRTAASFDQPARHLIVSDHGHRVITAIERGPTLHLGRIDLVRTRVTPWCDLVITRFARTFDGSRWFVASREPGAPGEDVLALDVTAARPSTLWRLSMPRGDPALRATPPPLRGTDPDSARGEPRLTGLARSKSRLALLTTSHGRADPGGTRRAPRSPELEAWVFELPSLTLRSRLALPVFGREQPSFYSHGIIEPNGAWVMAGDLPAETLPDLDAPGAGGALPIELRPCFWLTHAGRVVPGDLPVPSQPKLSALSSGWLVLVLEEPGSCSVRLLDTENARTCARLELEGATRVATQLLDSLLVVADDRGRIILFEHGHGRVVSSLRL